MRDSAKAVSKESPLTLRSHEFFLTGDPAAPSGPVAPSWGGRLPWAVAAVATAVSVVAVVLFAVERTTHAEQLGKREVRIAELEATAAKQADRLAAFEHDKKKAAADAKQAALEAEARAKIVVDALTASLAPEMKRGDARLETLPDGRVRVELSDRLLFPDKPALVGDAGREALARLGAVLAGLGDKPIEVVGHTDNRKPKDWQDRSYWELSSVRASAVVFALEETAKVPGKMLVAAGRGATDPKASNGTWRNRQKNRRVEITLTP